MTAMPGCVSEPLGCGLIDTPGNAKAHGVPSLPSIISALYPPPAARKKPIGLEAVGRGSEAERCQLGGNDAALGRAAGVKRLGHRAEVLAQSAGLRGPEAQRASRRF